MDTLRPAKHSATLAADTTLRIERILHRNTAFTLRTPIHLTLSEDGPYCLVEFEPLGLQGRGRDEQEAIESFAGQFCGMWEWIASAHNLDLTSDARRLKRKMLSLVKSVTPPASA